jgi:hypothetical protein
MGQKTPTNASRAFTKRKTDREINKEFRQIKPVRKPFSKSKGKTYAPGILRRISKYLTDIYDPNQKQEDARNVKSSIDKTRKYKSIYGGKDFK